MNMGGDGDRVYSFLTTKMIGKLDSRWTNPSGIIKLPMLGGSNKQQIYDMCNFEGFPLN